MVDVRDRRVKRSRYQLPSLRTSGGMGLTWNDFGDLWIEPEGQAPVRFSNPMVLGDVAVGFGGQDRGGVAEIPLDVSERAAGHEPKAGVGMAEIVDTHAGNSGPPARGIEDKAYFYVVGQEFARLGVGEDR